VKRFLLAFFVFSISCLIVYTNGRAGWLGFVAGLLFLSKHIFPLPAFKKIKAITLSIVIFLMTIALFWLKRDSSAGRLLIYKISANIFKDNYLWGIGFGQFQVEYNLYQSEYFSHSNFDGQEALLADNTFYAFNDLWQLLIEIGLIRFGVIITGIILLLAVLKKYYTVKNKSRIVYHAALAALFCIATASLFSYPFHVITIQVFALVCLSVIIFSLTLKSSTNKLTASLLSTFRILSVISVALVFFKGFQTVMQTLEANKAFELSRAGFKNKSLNVYSSLNSKFKDGPALFSFAKQLYNTNRLQQADSIIQQTKKYYTDHEVYKLSASIAYELGNLKQAETDYKTALYMVPNRMRSRHELFNFYLTIKDTVNAIYWGKSILNMSVKVPSSTTANLLKQTKNRLQALQKF
jgi:O-antigen ligase